MTFFLNFVISHLILFVYFTDKKKMKHCDEVRSSQHLFIQEFLILGFDCPNAILVKLMPRSAVGHHRLEWDTSMETMIYLCIFNYLCIFAKYK